MAPFPTRTMTGNEQNTTQGSFPLSKGNIDVWVLDLDSDHGTPEVLGGVLSSDEKARAARFHFERDQRRFIVGRGSMRIILSNYLAKPSESLCFSYSPHGKPSLTGISTDLRFNLSHSDQYGILAVTTEHEIGADIERIRVEVDTDKLAERFFSVNERASLRNMPPAERYTAFYRGWACKESLLKAWGTGLSRPLATFDVDLDRRNPAALLATRPDAEEARRWSLKMLDIMEGYASALAVEGAIQSLTVKAFKP